MARIVLALLLLTPAHALGHKLNIFAQVNGAAIVGRAYFPDDVPARQTNVIACDRSGHELARTKTDDQGNFTFRATMKTDYQITAETPDGHSATYPLSASELPDILPADASETAGQTHSVDKQSDSRGTAINGTSPSPLSDEITVLQKQVQALRDQIDKSDQQMRFRDILGGIGYILGLTGIAMYMKSRRTKDA
jgi:nickel transport protein